MRTGVIYIATVNNDKSYIGYTLDFSQRKRNHLNENSNSHFSQAIRKHGAENVEWRILEADIPETRLPDREVLWIAFYDTYHNGYNLTEGGGANPMQSAEARKKASETWKEKSARGENPTQNPEIAARAGKAISETMKAKGERGELPQQQPEGRAKMSRVMKARGERGELPQQQPEARAEASRKALERSARGENPMQNPEIAAKAVANQKATKLARFARERLQNWKESGQEFLTDMDLD